MNIEDIMREVAEVVRGCPTLDGTTYPYPSSAARAPAAIVTYPDGVRRKRSMGSNAQWVIDPSIVVLVGRLDAVGTMVQASKYVSGDDPDSIAPKLEAHTWTTCDFADVDPDETRTNPTFENYRLNEVDYLGLVFRLRVVGSGTA